MGGEGLAGLSQLLGLHVGELEGTEGAFVLLLQNRFIQVQSNIRKKQNPISMARFSPDVNSHSLADGCCWGLCGFGAEVSWFVLGQLRGLIHGDPECCFRQILA